eukprot:g19038.t1
MGDWIMVPRTRFGDDFVLHHYMKARPCRQLVLLGAGMDARAYRLRLPELKVFEVDLPILFQEKEPLLEGETLTVQSRSVVPTDFSSGEDWSTKLQRDEHFDPTQPTVWLLEGLMMYLTDREATQTLRRIGALSAPHSALFFDAISASYVRQRIVVGGAPFLGGSDHYAEWLKEAASFGRTQVWDFNSMRVVHYSFWVSMLCLWQIRCFLQQLSQADDGPAVSKVSMLCIAIQALTDAYDSFLHLCLGISSQETRGEPRRQHMGLVSRSHMGSYLFNSMSMVALFKFLLCSLLEARYLLIILRHRRHEAFSEGWESVRREVSWLYTRFYGALVMGSLVVYNCLAYLDVVVLVLQLYWVPLLTQMTHTSHMHILSRNTLRPTFITSMSASRLMLPLYLWGCPKTIFTGEIYPRLPGAPSLQWCLVLVGLQAIQVGVLLLQKRLGARWFIPWVCMPWAYNYHRFMEIEAGSECVICMADLNPEEPKPYEPR